MLQLATHHWSHTWLNDLSGKSTTEIVQLVPSEMLSSGFQPTTQEEALTTLRARQSKVHRDIAVLSASSSKGINMLCSRRAWCWTIDSTRSVPRQLGLTSV